MMLEDASSCLLGGEHPAAGRASRDRARDRPRSRALQLLVAEGAELPREAKNARINGHAIEVRLYAEDPANEWRPSVGRLYRFGVGGDAIRVDSGVEDGSVVSPWYDPMLAKVIAYRPSRSEAARALSFALAGAQIHGITTNRDLLVRVLRHPEFVAGNTDTAFLVENDPAQLGAPLATPQAELLHGAAAALASQAHARCTAKTLAGLPSGWRNNPSEPQHKTFASSRGEIRVSYLFDRTGRCAHITSEFEGRDPGDDPDILSSVSPEVLSASPIEVTLCHRGVNRSYDVHRVDQHVFVDGPDGSSALTVLERFVLPGTQLDPGSFVAPLPGTIVRVDVAVGDHVSAGETLVAIEAMKMEHEVRAGHGGVVTEVAVGPGDQVESGRLLVVLKED